MVEKHHWKEQQQRKRMRCRGHLQCHCSNARKAGLNFFAVVSVVDVAKV